jgi:hypothetical protein
LCFHKCLDHPGKSRNNIKKGCGRPTKSTPKVGDAVEEIAEKEPETPLLHLSREVNLSAEWLFTNRVRKT